MAQRSRNKPIEKSHRPFENTTVVSDHVDHFGSGQINSRFYGKVLTKEFQTGVRVLENMDIVDQGALVKRKGAVQDRRFVFSGHFQRDPALDGVSATDVLGVGPVSCGSRLTYVNFRVFNEVVVYVLGVSHTLEVGGRGANSVSGHVFGAIDRKEFDDYGNRPGLFDFDPTVPVGETLSSLNLNPVTVYSNYVSASVALKAHSRVKTQTYGRLYPPFLPMFRQRNPNNFMFFISTVNGYDVGRSVIEKIGNSRYIIMFPNYPGGVVPIIVEPGKEGGVYTSRFMGDVGKKFFPDTGVKTPPMSLKFSELGFHRAYRSDGLINKGFENTTGETSGGGATRFYEAIGTLNLLDALPNRGRGVTDAERDADNEFARRVGYANYATSGSYREFPVYGYVVKRLEIASFLGINFDTPPIPEVDRDDSVPPEDIPDHLRNAGGRTVREFVLLGIPYVEIEYLRWEFIRFELRADTAALGDIIVTVGVNPYTVTAEGGQTRVTGLPVANVTQPDVTSRVAVEVFKPNIIPARYGISNGATDRTRGVNVEFLGSLESSNISQTQNTLVMLCDMDEDLLARSQLGEDTPGLMLIETGEIDASGDAPKLSARIVLAMVFPLRHLPSNVVFDRPKGFNCYLKFFTNSALELAGNWLKKIDVIRDDSDNVTGFNIVRDGLGFESPETMRRTLRTLARAATFYFPMFNHFDGFPSTVSQVDQRTVLSGFSRNRVAFSYRRDELGFSNVFPFQLDIGQKVIDSIKAENENVILPGDKELNDNEKSIALGFAPKEDTDDYIRFYNTATAPTFQTMIEDLSLSSNEDIKWVASHRDLMIGTSKQEFFVTTPNRGPLTANTIALRNFQSARGSGSVVTAKGDYNFFFVGADKRTIYSAAFAESVGGMRSSNATYIGGLEIGEVEDMVWDTRRNALWVLYRVDQEAQIALFFNSTEYEVMGWSYYTFDGDKFRNIRNFVHIGEDIGFVLANGEVFRMPFDTLYYTDDGQQIKSRITFFRVPTRGGKGNPSLWDKRVGKTTLFCQNVTELVYNKKAKVVYPLNAATEEGVIFADCGGHVRGRRVPYLDVEHTKDEPATFLAISSRYEIMEE